MEEKQNKRVRGAPGPKIIPAVPPKDDPSEGLLGELEDGPKAPEEALEEEPKVRTRKESDQEIKELKESGIRAKKKERESVKPTDDFVRNKKGEIRKDEEGDDMRYAPGCHDKGGGFVNENGVRFPPGFKFPGGFIGTFGNVILNRCPRCGHRQSIDDARSGRCGNDKCGFNQVLILEEYELD